MPPPSPFLQLSMVCSSLSDDWRTERGRCRPRTSILNFGREWLIYLP
jgi:hypothetical protein